MAQHDMKIGCNECGWIGNAMTPVRCGYCGHVNVSPVDPEDEWDVMDVLVEAAAFTVNTGREPNTVLMSRERYNAIYKFTATHTMIEGELKTINGWQIVICDVPRPCGFAVCYLLLPEDFPADECPYTGE